MTTPADTPPSPKSFIDAIVEADTASGVFDGNVVTRFPPEPNGYLHIGHAYASTVSYSVAQRYNGRFHLRFDDTNPKKENVEFVDAQQRDLRWLGIEWGEHLYYASDYFEQLYQYAVDLTKKGLAFVCELDPEAIREQRGSFTKPGVNSPYRDRPIEENLELFAKMKAGEIAEGKAVLRAKIDMAAKNPVMRDPVMYRIYHHPHYRAGADWCIYPIYDWAHGLEDSIEGVTHSLCSIEFENNRELYDWYLDKLGVYHPKQIEFSKLAFQNVILGKRQITKLVADGKVWGWNDPRLLTLAGMRRRGYTPESIRGFLGNLGVTKAPMSIEHGLLDHHLREDLNRRALRKMAILEPLRLVITNYPEGQDDLLDAENNPEDPEGGNRKVPFGKVIYIEKEDFMVDAPKKYFRLAPGKEVRLKHAYFIKYEGHTVDEATGEVTEVRCTYDPLTRGGSAPDGRKVKGTLHWVSAEHAVEAEVRLFEELVLPPSGDDDEREAVDRLNPDSVKVLTGCQLEGSLGEAKVGDLIQFFRHGYFCVDEVDSTPERMVFNRAISLKDSWAKTKKKLGV